MQPFRESVLQIIAQVCREEEIVNHPDTPLFASGLLDSMGIVELLVQFSEKLHIDVPITEFNREAWATPELILAALEQRRSGEKGE